jgi:Pyridoxal-dependent decarboxylase conserved domain
VETAGPRYMAYVGGGGLFTSALAEMVARAFNRYTTLARFAPALVGLEESTLRWLCREFGLPATAGGVTTTGGSLATLVAMVAARHDRLGDDFADGTLNVTAQTHRCVAKAARLAGLPAGAIQTVPSCRSWRSAWAATSRPIGTTSDCWSDRRHQAALPVEHPHRRTASLATLRHLTPHPPPGRGGRRADHPRRRRSRFALPLIVRRQENPGST